METFTEILSDDIDNKISNEILCSLKYFMSDRAKKNIAITDMMPQISNSWDELDLEQRDTCCRINHFFCGLRLLLT